MIIDFRAGAPAWPSIDDVVMGGRSHSEMVIEDGVAAFRGVVSLENNGGFASVRSNPADHDLAGLTGWGDCRQAWLDLVLGFHRGGRDPWHAAAVADVAQGLPSAVDPPAQYRRRRAGTFGTRLIRNFPV